jgi:hypothetical protein
MSGTVTVHIEVAGASIKVVDLVYGGDDTTDVQSTLTEVAERALNAYAGSRPMLEPS